MQTTEDLKKHMHVDSFHWKSENQRQRCRYIYMKYLHIYIHQYSLSLYSDNVDKQIITKQQLQQL